LIDEKDLQINFTQIPNKKRLTALS